MNLNRKPLLPLLMFLLLSTVHYGLQDVDTQPLTHTFNMYLDGKGYLRVNVLVQYMNPAGESWILLPKNTSVEFEVVNGHLTAEGFVKALTATGEEFIFYTNYTFTYLSENGLFKMLIKYNFSNAAFIIEPKGYFLSPQLGLPDESRAIVNIYMPPKFRVNPSDIRLFSNEPVKNLNISMKDGYEVISLIPTNLDRVVIEFNVDEQPEFIYVRYQNFTFKTVKRYRDLAEKILSLYVKAYPIYKEIFKVNLGNVTSEFFFPQLEETPLGTGGYIPFTSTGTIGSIHLNVFYTRTIKGYLEIVALHELAHHFIWKSGISPELLWIHEGLATYISLETAKQLGLKEAAKSYSLSLLEYAKYLNEDFGFVQKWTPRSGGTQPYYSAAYYIFNYLGGKYGGLNYYGKVFGEVSRTNIAQDLDFIKCLSDAAGEDLTTLFRRWGFEIPYLLPQPIKAILIDNPVLPANIKKSVIGLIRNSEEEFNRGDHLNGALYLFSAAISLTFIYGLPILLLSLILIRVFRWSIGRRCEN